MLNERSRRSRTSQRAAVGDTLAGWRLVRALSTDYGEFLGVADFGSNVGEPMSRHWAGFSSTGQPQLRHRRVIVAHGTEAEASLARECAIRDDVRSEFVELTEETILEEGTRIAIFPMRHVRPWSDVIASGITLHPAALVTALVPIVETIHLAHQNGIAHGAISLAACQFDETGRPRLDDWGSASRLNDLAAVKSDLARNSDLRSLGRVADAMLALSPSAPADQVRQLVASLCDGITPKDAAERLADALFQWAEPGPLPTSAIPGVPQSSPNNALPVLANGALFERSDEDDDVTNGDEPLWPDPPNRSFRDRWRPISDRFAPVWHSTGNVRPTIWACVGAVGAIILGGGIVLGFESVVDHSNSTEEVHSVAVDKPTPSEPVGSADKPVGFPVPESESSLASVTRLLASRNECVTQGETNCLESLYAKDAPGLLADLERTSEPDSAAASLVPEQEWTLAADLGDIELFSGSDGVSLSVERTPEGWKLRDMWFSPND